MTLADPTFPPLLNGLKLAAGEDPFDAACRAVAERRLGAGDLLWSAEENRVALAIVLEPEVGQAAALQMIPLAAIVWAECIGALAPPQVAVTFGWPDRIHINGGVAGGIRAALEPGEGADAPPRWLVLGLSLTLRHDGTGFEPGDRPDVTALAEEGGGALDRTVIIESYARHFLTWLHTWEETGFKPVHEAYLFRAEAPDEPRVYAAGDRRVAGTIIGLDEDANLLVKDGDGEVVCLALADMVAVHERKATLA